jgi:outer membrane protein assembly factor BamD
MKKQVFLVTLICITLLTACTAAPQPKKAKTDEYYFSEAMDFFNSRNCFDAIPAFEEFKEKFPLSPYAVLAELRLGDCHYFKGEYVEAIHYFENFRRLHPSNQHVPYSIFMTGMCHYKQILTSDRDQTFAKEAVEHFQLLFELYSRSPYAGKALCKISEAKKRIAEHELFIGRFYLKKKNYKGAIERFSKILKKYPQTMDKDKLLFYLAEATIHSGNKNKGKKILKLLLKRYPESEYAVEAKALLALHSSGEEKAGKETP